MFENQIMAYVILALLAALVISFLMSPLSRVVSMPP